ncbi:MAG: 6-hydroxymethylpterin diphosphokinase MptE-like protein [Colwellia sp.]|jgi:Uncharacterized protein conserved in bacteria
MQIIKDCQWEVINMSNSVMDLTENQVDMIKKADIRKVENLRFFKEFHTKIYERFKDFRLTNYKVNFNTKLSQFDIYHKGESIYNDMPISYAKEELAQFYEKYAENKRFNTITAPFDSYILPRFFHQSCQALLKKSPISRQNYEGYIMPGFYPIMAFHGVGAGYHVQEFLSTNVIINCLIIENDEELFAASLYTTNWKEICQPFLKDTKNNIHFIIGPIEDELKLMAFEFQYLSMHCPLYPISTLFINHRNSKIYQRLTKKINEDTTAFATVWGHYDDEIYQLNNCLHNLQADHKIIQPCKPDFLDIPVFIIGGGPSLSERIEEVIRHKDKAIIISCGTAIHSLYHYGIKPDIHFELESHLVTLTHLKALKDDAWLKSIPIIGPTQIPPRVFNLFDKKTLYFKGESATNFLFGDKYSAVTRGTPTCTNGAIALFLHWGFKEIYMFGVDMGYKDTNNHHAKGAIYYTTNDRDLLLGSDVAKEATVTIEGVHGDVMKTKPILYTAKRTIETCAMVFSKTSTIYNCSDGAKMENTIWLSNEALNKQLEYRNTETVKHEFIKWEFDDNENTIDKKKIDSRIDVLEHNLQELGNHIISKINNSGDDFYSFTCTINQISRFLEMKIKSNLPSFYFFIRGSIWHLLYIGFSHALSISDEEEKTKWIKTWKQEAEVIIKGLSTHLSKTVHKKFNINTDPWTWTSTSEPE